MPDEHGLARVIETLGWDIDAGGVELTGSASGSGVFRVRIDEADAVLKVTTAGRGQLNARRELTFYRTMAGQVPVTTPRLLRHADNDELTALLLSAHTPAHPAWEWDESAWLELARQLAAVHSTPLPEERSWLETPWLQRALDRPPVDLAEDYWSRTEAAGRIGPVLDAIAALAAALTAVPDCFVHGDCHVDNLLRDGQRVVWADWQVAGVGSPAIDLAFLWSRANADGADLPYAAMVNEYVAHRGIDAAVLRQSLIAAELGVLLFGWPEYAAFRTQTERDRLTRRLLDLIDAYVPFPAGMSGAGSVRSDRTFS
jgi:Ser/Thr protein kinase RdoA (MazF antagonist)